MTTSPSPILGLSLQSYSSNAETWGHIVLNDVIKQLEEASHGVISVAVDADVTLTSTNYVSNETRQAVLVFTGEGGHTVTLDGAEKRYLLHNKTTNAVTVSNGGVVGQIPAGQMRMCYTDGTDVYIDPDDDAKLNLSGGTMTGALLLNADATESMQAVTFQQMNQIALGAVSVNYSFSAILNKPTTLGGYGITDGQLKFSTVDVDHTNVPTQTQNQSEYWVDSATQAISLSLHSGSSGDRVRVIDNGGVAQDNNITISPASGQTILGDSDGIIIDESYRGVELRYVGSNSDWRVARL